MKKKIWFLLLLGFAYCGTTFACWNTLPPEDELMYQLMIPISQYYQQNGTLDRILPLLENCEQQHPNPTTQKACQKINTTFLGKIERTPFDWVLSGELIAMTGHLFKAPLGYPWTRVENLFQIGEWRIGIPNTLDSTTRGSYYQNFLIAKQGDSHWNLFPNLPIFTDYHPFFLRNEGKNLIFWWRGESLYEKKVYTEKVVEFAFIDGVFRKHACRQYLYNEPREQLFALQMLDRIVKKPIALEECPW